MNCVTKKLTALLTCAATALGACMIPTAADAAATVYDEGFDTVCKVGEANHCYSAQGMAVGDEYLYSVQIGDNDARAVVHRVHKDTGDRVLMEDSETGETYFTNFGHANDLDWVSVDGVEYLYVLANSNLLIYTIEDTKLVLYREFQLKYNGSTFDPGGMAVQSVTSSRITLLFKWKKSISTAVISRNMKKGNISVALRCHLDVTNVTVDGEERDFSSFVNQGMGYEDGYLFVPITGNDDDNTINHSLILAYDIRDAKNGVTVRPDEDKTFYVISEEYPALFEIEDCGISSDGKLYFNTNSRRSNSNTKHDGVFVLNDFVFEASTPIYTVKYNAGGGTGNMPAVSVSVKDALKNAANAFTREGYTFAGWDITSALSGAEVKIGDTVTEGDIITFTAQWKKISADTPTYTIRYNAGGGTGSMASATVETTTPITPAANAFTREGYTFTGWGAYSELTKKNVNIGDTAAEGDTITLTAQWEKNAPTTYTVQYDGNGGTGKMKSQTVSATTPLTPARNTFTRDGYAFMGWTATGALTGEEIAVGDTVTAGDTVTLTARWDMYADMNGDGKLNIADAVLIRLYEWGYYPLSGDRLFLMDVNDDGVVNASDFHILLAYLGEALEFLPVCE